MRTLLCLVVGLLGILHAEPPQVSVTNIRRVFHNGEHNAFTDLCRFRDQLYLAFRSCPDGHMVHPTASTIIMRSKDEGTTWEQVHRFSIKDRDTRDPHFLVFKDRLFVYTGTWWSGPGKIEPVQKRGSERRQLANQRRGVGRAGFAVGAQEVPAAVGPVAAARLMALFQYRCRSCSQV